MPLSPKKQARYASRNTPSAKLRFLYNTCDSMVQMCNILGINDDDKAGPSSDTDEKYVANYMPCSTENHCCALLHGLQQLRKSNTLCDYTLIADGQRIPVHRAVMAACSDYFRVMLAGFMRESREEFVELKGVTAGGLTVVVDFAYTGRLKLTNDNVEEVLSAASHLQVMVVVELCSKYLELALTVYNCTDILNFAQMYSLTSTQTKAMQYMMDNFETVSASEQFSKLTHTQLATMLQDNSLKVPSEYRLFTIVLLWIDHDKTERAQYLAELMKNIRLPLLAGEELVEKVSKVEIMRTNQECSDLLTQAKDYNIVTSKQPMLQSSRTQVRSNHQSIVMFHAQNLACYTFHNKHHGVLRNSLIPLFNPSVAVLDNFMYACCGKRCFRFDPRFDSWYELPSMNEARENFVVVAYNGKLYAVGGQVEKMIVCTVESYSVANEIWEMCASISYYCYCHAGAVCRDKIYISGGYRFSGCASNMSDISGGQRFLGYASNMSCYSPDVNVWEEKTPMLNRRCKHVMVEVKNKLYVVGGNIGDSYGFLVPIIAIEFYNPETDQWSHCKATCNIREAGACMLSNKIYIVGGISGQHYSDMLQEYDPEKDRMSIVDRFPTRVYGRACCILTLPNYLSGIGSNC